MGYRYVSVVIFILLVNAAIFAVDSLGVTNTHYQNDPSAGTPLIISAGACSTLPNGTVTCNPSQKVASGGFLQMVLVFGDFLLGLQMFGKLIVGVLLPGYFLAQWGVPLYLVAMYTLGVWIIYFLAIIQIISGRIMEN